MTTIPPGPQALLRTDHHGNPVELEKLMKAGLDGQYADRVPALRELLHADDPFDRFDACYLLASWGDPAGLRQIAEWAAHPSEVPWGDRYPSTHRLYPVEDTYEVLAGALMTSFLQDPDPERRQSQVAAAKALLGLASTHFVGITLMGALMQDPSFPAEIRDELRRAVEDSVRVLREGRGGPFDPEFQTISLVDLLATMDDEAAATAAETLAEVLAHQPRWLELLARLTDSPGPRTRAIATRVRHLIAISDQQSTDTRG
jgi:hypothetical protein